MPKPTRQERVQAWRAEEEARRRQQQVQRQTSRRRLRVLWAQGPWCRQVWGRYWGCRTASCLSWRSCSVRGEVAG